MNNPELLPHIIAKMCHEFATPLNAINILGELILPQIEDKEISSAFEESLVKFQFKLNFFRSFFSTSIEQPTFNEIKKLLVDYGKLIKAEVTILSTFPDGMASRLLLGIGFITLEALIRGGELTCEFNENGVIFHAQGAHVQLRPGYIEAFEQKSIEFNSRNVLPAYISQVALYYGLHITIQQSKNNLILKLTPS